MRSTGIGFKTNAHEINRGTFANVMLRQMVEQETGDVSDAEYELAVRTTAEKLGLKNRDGYISLRRMSAGTLSYISSQIAETVIAGRPEKAGAF